MERFWGRTRERESGEPFSRRRLKLWLKSAACQYKASFVPSLLLQLEKTKRFSQSECLFSVTLRPIVLVVVVWTRMASSRHVLKRIFWPELESIKVFGGATSAAAGDKFGWNLDDRRSQIFKMKRRDSKNLLTLTTCFVLVKLFFTIFFHNILSEAIL